MILPSYYNREPTSALTREQGVLLNNYSPKAKLISVNKNRDKVEPEMNEPEVNNCFSIIT